MEVASLYHILIACPMCVSVLKPKPRAVILFNFNAQNNLIWQKKKLIKQMIKKVYIFHFETLRTSNFRKIIFPLFLLICKALWLL